MKTIQMNQSVSIFRPLITKNRSDDTIFCTLNTILRHLNPWVKSDGGALFVTRTCWWQRRLANAWMLGFRHLWMASSENKRCVRSAAIFGDWDAKLNLGSEATFLKHMNWWYCWWKKSCTTWDEWNPINNGISYLSGGAGFLNHQQYLLMVLGSSTSLGGTCY